jgi:hypothetical protein
MRKGLRRRWLHAVAARPPREIPWYPAYSTVDAYTKWYDKVTGGGKAVETRQG